MKRPLWVIGTAGILAVIAVMLTGYRNGLLLIAAGVGSALFFCLRRDYRFARNVTAVTLCAAVFLGLFAYKETCVTGPAEKLEGREIALSGRVLEPPEQKPRSVELKLGSCTINGEKTSVRFFVYAGGISAEDIKLYDTVNISAIIPRAAAKDGAFYYHTLSGGYILQGYARKAVVAEKYEGSSLLYKLKVFRLGLRESLVHQLGERGGAIAAALLIGDKTLLPDTFTAALRVSGASHMFAVSGMHLSLWSGLIFLLLRKRSKVRVLPNIAASLFVLVYAALTGFSPSVLRAAIMTLSVFISRMIRQRSDPLNALGFSGAVMLLFNVYLAGNVSFLLSYAATAALIILVPQFTSSLRHKDSIPVKGTKTVKNTILMSLGVLLFTIPFSGFFFGTVSLLSPVSTLLCTVPVEFSMLSSGLTALTGSIPGVGRIFGLLAQGSAALIDKLILFLGQMDFAVFPVHLPWILVWYTLTGVAALLAWFRKKKPEAPLSALLISVIVLLSVQIGVYARRGKEVEIFIPAAGNSTSVCISSVYGTNSVLIGAGRDYDALAPMRTYWQERGISGLKTLIIPRCSDAENGNTSTILSLPIADVYSPKDNPSLGEGSFSEAENYTLDLPFGLRYTNILSDNCAAGIIENAELRIVLIYYPGGKYSPYGELLQKGDYLICRGAIPEDISPENFGKVFVLSDKTAGELHLPEGMQTTADAGPITIKTVAE